MNSHSFIAFRPKVNAAPLTVLLDGMIRPWAITHIWMMKPQTVQWGPRKITLPVANLEAKAPLGQIHAWLQGQLDCLPHIAHLAEVGNIKCYTTIEIAFEGWGRPGVDGKGTEIDLFRNVRIEKIPPAVNRTMQWSRSEGETKERKQAFLKSIREPRFLELVSVIGLTHAGDIFHLWSAEKAGLDCFLSADRKFINAVNNARKDRRKVKIKVDVLSPSELCERFHSHQRLVSNNED